jgi:hypothetical protein
VVLRAVEGRGAHPVLEGQRVAVLDAHPALLGRVHEEQAAERPVRLAAERLLRLLVEEDHLASRVDEFRGRRESRETRSDHDHICVVRHEQVLLGLVTDRSDPWAPE